MGSTLDLSSDGAMQPITSFCPRRAFSLLALLGTVAAGLMVVACGSSGAPGVDECANLREIQASAGGSIEGKFDYGLDDFEFAADGQGDYSVQPPDASPCARDIAARLEGACRICRESDSACETTVQGVLDQPTQYCQACGDDVCQPDESPANCPQDCADACGNGTCEGTESFQTCPADCSQSGCGDTVCAPGENPTNCPVDCASPCGDGRCSGDEDPASCPQDCDTGRCGDGRCNAGETLTSCREDCGRGCGNGACEDDESGVLCPEDCNGCVPNESDCQGSVLIVCNPDGASTTSRSCGAGFNCREGACRASNPQAGQADVEAQMLGFWRVTLDLVASNGTTDVAAGNVSYVLEIFSVSVPDGQFGVWGWKGALKADGLCLLDSAAFSAGGGTCVALGAVELGGCDTAACDTSGPEVAAHGTFNSVTHELIVDRGTSPTRGDLFHFDVSMGFVELRTSVHGAGIVVNDAVPADTCEGSYCDWHTDAANGTPLADRFLDTNGSGWSIRLERITGR